MSSLATVTIRPDLAHGAIRPELYGHFAEHLGRCIYEGLWVGPDSPISHNDGIRRDTVEALAHIGAPVLRWPGGCFADAYHWEDGIGPRESRPHRPNVWWNGQDTNAFGTDEFLRTCEMIGAEPYICLNVGSGTPQEALAWLEYCNYSGETEYTRRRAANGHPEPYGVKYWGVGNENWGCGGNFTARDYAKEYRRFATYLLRLDPTVELIACGHTTRDWNPELLDELRDHLHLMHHLSVHRYTAAEFPSSWEAYWRPMLGIEQMERDIVAAAGAIRAYTQGRRSIGVVMDEWGLWYPQAVVENGLRQPNTLRDALFAASAFHMFHRHADVLTMTNIAQTINVLQCLLVTDGEKIARTPTYHAYAMYRPHMGAHVVPAEADTPEVSFSFERKERTLPTLDAAASLGSDGTLTVSVVNRHPDETIEATVRVGGMRVREASAMVLTGPTADAENLPGEEELVRPEAIPCAAEGEEFAHVFPPRSITVFRLGG